ncbi:MAG: DUF3854 domain-containing protein [Planctomycetes bacterium]|nr:DUF3854 domain-containing protein [Planctomycetota bacterium]
MIKGKAVKYETPKDSHIVIDVPPRARSWIRDPGRPLFITEGVRKADAGVSIGACTIALLGVWNWRGSNEFGGKTTLPEWDQIALKDRMVYIVFDSDLLTKSTVQQAMWRLRSFLDSKRANVRVVRLPTGDGGAKVGLDDYFATGKTVDDLLALASDAIPEPEDTTPTTVEPPRYEARPEGLIRIRKTPEGDDVATLLTNFCATIEAEVIHDDGVEVQRAFRICASWQGGSATVTVPVREFDAMNWVTEHLGASAIVYAGMGARDNARTAILILSGRPSREVIYTHLGWRKLDGVGWVFLHAAGATGTLGTLPGVRVSPPAQLARACLPDPSAGDQLIQDLRAVLALRELGPARIVLLLLAAVIRAIFGNVPFSVHLVGKTGTFKSAIAGVYQAFFGAGFDGENLPGSWSSTGNAVETLAFLAKDMVFVVDDFAPAGARNDVQRMHRDADRIFRAQGNQQGRARLDSKAQLRQPRPPRGLIISTGEDTPTGHSIRARLVVIEVAAGEIKADVLTECQRRAKEGIYARATAAFVMALAGNLEAFQCQLRQRAAHLRDESSGSSVHRRTPTIASELQAALEFFFTFCHTKGAITDAELRELHELAAATVGSVAAEQVEFLNTADPVNLFIRLLRSAISSGHAHVADVQGGQPKGNVAAFGWRAPSDSAAGELRAMGIRCGWLEGDDLYLDPDAAIKAANMCASDTEHVSLTPRMLSKHLEGRGLLRELGRSRKRLLVRKQIQGARAEVLHVSVSLLGVTSPSSQTSPDDDESDAEDAPEPVSGTFVGDVRADGDDANVPHERPTQPPTEPEAGTIGTFGTFAEGGATSELDDNAWGRL